ncbi:BLOC-1- complex subunit 8 [Desmophyllum pertusum]|uniref:BLOC-1- complex subunit 8 n=1 Tax=Desmophyllum pertusum TaxID=174260 RepID=A0A9W9YT79_9CNID|nr:BLOC-1- complex subunit 8 [Desmophyllum pertusum]
MAGISELYTAKAMLDSQMVHMGKQADIGSLEFSNQETEYKLRRVTEKFLENIHTMLNEPSVGLYRVQEHVRRSLPQLVDRKIEMQSLHKKVQGISYDVEYSLKTVQSMRNISHFTIIQECLKSAIASKKNLDRRKLERKDQKPDASGDTDDEPEVLESVEGFICPNCMQTWSDQEELLQHWQSAHEHMSQGIPMNDTSCSQDSLQSDCYNPWKTEVWKDVTSCCK